MWRIARAAAVVGCVGLAVAPATAREVPLVQAGSSSRLVGIIWNYPTASLVPVDPSSLRPQSGRAIELFRYAGAWAFSPDRTLLALAGSCDIGTALGRGISFVDVARFRPAGCLWLGNVVATAWPAPSRLVAVTCCPLEAVSVDPVRRRVLARSSIEGGQVVGTASAGRDLVLLLGSGGLGRLVAVDERAAVRTAALDLPVGLQSREARFVRPGLAVDSAGRRVFVVPAAGPVVEVSLETLAVASHDLHESVSLLGRLAAWLEPAARAKELPGTSRSAVWVGGDKLAITGSGGPGGPEERAGLALVDTRTWSMRTLDGGADSVTVSQGRIAATGPRVGLAVFDRDGRPLYRRFAGRTSWVELIHRGRIYAQVRGEGPMRVLELATGKQLGRREARLPQLLLSGSSS